MITKFKTNTAIMLNIDIINAIVDRSIFPFTSSLLSYKNLRVTAVQKYDTQNNEYNYRCDFLTANYEKEVNIKKV